MAPNDYVKCPLCEGLGRMARDELLRILRDPNLNDKVAQQVLELSTPVPAGLVGVEADREQAHFERDVHTWNPAQQMWRRSQKE